MNTFSIRPSRDIRNNYAEISKLCRENPVAVTVNGREDTIIMSHEQFIEQQRQIEEMQARLQFYAHLAQSEEDIKMNRVFSDQEVYASLRASIKEMQL